MLFFTGANGRGPPRVLWRGGCQQKDGEWAFVPVAVGFFLGAYFVYGADILIKQLGFGDGIDFVKALDTEKTKTDAADVGGEAVGSGRVLRSRAKPGASKDTTDTDDAAAKVWCSAAAPLLPVHASVWL